MATEIKKFLGTAAVEQLIANTRAEIAAGDSKTLGDAKAYADGLASNYDAAGVAETKVNELANGQVKTNKEAIEKLNGGATVEGSVAKQIADAKSELNGTISTVEGKADAAQADADALETDMGDVDTLSTTNKTVVGAINEVLAAVGTGGTAAVVTITTETTTDGALKSYTVKQGDTTVGVIDIPKDMVVQSGEVVTNPAGQPAGTYIKLVLANATNDEIFVNVGNLVDIYKAKAGATQVQLAIDASTREISASIVAGSITATELAADSVITAKIADGNVTKAKLSTEVQASLDKADGAAADAQSKADAALAEAKSYADQAEADAISTAAGDATSKANKALEDAKADATEKANKALSDAQSYADQAEADANTYADGLNTAMDTRVKALENVSYVEITADEIDAMFA